MNQDSKKPTSEITEPTMVAVIDIGSTSVRMQISEIDSDGNVRNFESFSQAVSLGKDAFVSGSIKKVTIEDCVKVLQTYRLKLNEYDITEENCIRVIATSAVKEARNRLAFQDRIFIATGFAIEPFDEAELHRVTYLGILPLFNTSPGVFKKTSVICEVGGGTTELLSLTQNDVAFSQTLRLGAIRLRTRLEQMKVPEGKVESLLSEQIRQFLRQLPDTLFEQKPHCYIAMGSEIRFAAKELLREKEPGILVELDFEQLSEFVSEINSQSPDSLATRYHLSVPDAESLGPSLLVHKTICQQLGASKFFVASVNLRDGILQEMAHGRSASESVQRQVVRSTNLIGQKYNVDQMHANHVAFLACELFDQLQQLHQLPTSARDLLEVSALLHESGLYVGNRSYHKHTAYLIRNSEFFGVGAHDREIVSLIARYHRRATPQPRHEVYSRQSRDDRAMVCKLAVLLRIAKAMDASRKQRIKNPMVSIKGNRVIITTRIVADLSLEQLQLSQARPFFEDIFGLKIVLNVLRRKTQSR